MTGETKSGVQRARLYGLGASGLQGPGSAPYSTLLYSTSIKGNYTIFNTLAVALRRKKFLHKNKSILSNINVCVQLVLSDKEDKDIDIYKS
jgi:hypothetical protein